MKRRNFIKNTALSSFAIGSVSSLLACTESTKETNLTQPYVKPSPIAICTWGFVDANAEAGKLLSQNMNALDAAIGGVAIEEKNIKNTTVGKGGTPDREGNVTLDACVMDQNGNTGAVTCVENITHVAQLAKAVMTKTPHVMLTGKGAEEFAYQQGFKAENLLTKDSEKAWKEWLKTSDYKPIINIENHDTIGMLTLDHDGNLSGACTTSGLAYKMKGRVGDSPIIGAGLFVDNEIGGAVATGMGEEIIKSIGSFLIVELMRQGKSPQEACEEAINRIVNKNPKHTNFQVAFIALNKNGDTGSYCIHKGFTYMKYQNKLNNRIEAKSFLDS